MATIQLTVYILGITSMARYTSSFIANAPLEQVPVLLTQVLESSDFGVVYQTNGYLMAKEIPGKVPFSKIVSVEILIENTVAKTNEVPVTFVVKNDELPLNTDNHCQQKFQQLQETLEQSQEWRSTSTVLG